MLILKSKFYLLNKGNIYLFCHNNSWSVLYRNKQFVWPEFQSLQLTAKLQIWIFKKLFQRQISWIKKCSITSKLVKSKTNMHTQSAGTTKLESTSNQFNLKWCYPQPNDSNNSLVTPVLWLVSFLECHTDLDLVVSWKLTSRYIDSLTSQTIGDNKRKRHFI